MTGNERDNNRNLKRIADALERIADILGKETVKTPRKLIEEIINDPSVTVRARNLLRKYNHGRGFIYTDEIHLPDLKKTRGVGSKAYDELIKEVKPTKRQVDELQKYKN